MNVTKPTNHRFRFALALGARYRNPEIAIPKADAPFAVLIFTLIVTALTALPCQAIRLPGPDLPTLLQVTSHTQIAFGQDARVDYRQTLISRGGGVLDLLASGRPGAPPSTFGFRGLGTSAQLLTLGQALSAARVGVQRDCALGGFGDGFILITWFGREGRTNTFRVTLQPDEPIPDRVCSSAVSTLVSAIERFRSDAISGIPQD